jgi:hypothetical protein
MAVQGMGLLSRRLIFLGLTFIVCQSGSPLMARSGEERRPPTKAEASKAETVAPPSGRIAAAVRPARRMQGGPAEKEAVTARPADGANPWAGVDRRPREQRMRRSRSWDGDLRSLPQTRPVRRERPEREGPKVAPGVRPGTALVTGVEGRASAVAAINAPAPAPTASFDGLDFANWGAGHPPDTNGDVGPDHYIESINSSVGVYRKSDGAPLAAFTLDTFMSQGNFGNLCDTDNFGDPIVLYDTFEDRWVVTDFAFKLSGANILPPALQCFAVSKTGDPVAGGWNFFSIETLGGLGDYPKLGIWPDGIYMSANMYDYSATGDYQLPRVWAFNKAQLYAGAPTVQVVTFDGPASDFTLLPSNARLQTGTPPAGAPNYFLSTFKFLNALTVYKFHVDWNSIALSTFTGPDVPFAATSWPLAAVPDAPSQGGNSLDVIQIRAMMQNQYSNIAGAESLWVAHTVRRGSATGFAAPRWYQVNVTGGTVAANLVQAATWDPDGANVIHRFVPSVAVNRNGDMAIGYSTSSSTTKPAIKYAGRLSADPVNTFSQTEQVLIQGAGTQTGNCGGSPCGRWGDYSAMTLDPDGCTFWFSSEYYKADGLDHQTRIGSFAFPGCTPVGDGGLSGIVRRAGSGAPIAGATVTLGSRTATSDGSGAYSFTLPAGTYPSATASFAGLVSSTVAGIVVADGATTTQDFTLGAAAVTACFTDTTQADFLQGVPANVDLMTTPGDVTLAKADAVDQQSATLGVLGASFTGLNWIGQTFTAAATGPVVRVDFHLFSANCGAVTMPNVTVAIRNTFSNLPTGFDLAVATIPGFCNPAGGYYTATFATPATVTAGTQYAIVLRAASAMPTGSPAPGYFGTVSPAVGTAAQQNPYAGGGRTSSATLGFTWVGPTGIASNDHGFKVYVNHGYVPSGTLTSSAKDANPVGGAIPSWGALSWVASTITGSTGVNFQVAGSDSPAGTFAFVGPDGTAGTFFANGGSLAQFDGKRYLKYKASLTSSVTSATPTLSTVTTCFQDVPSTTALSVAPASGVFGSTADLSATLTVGGVPLAGKTVTFTLDGAAAGSATTDSSGVATALGASLAAFSAGTYPGAAAASFEGDAGYAGSAGIATLTVTQAPATLTLMAASLSAVYDGSPHAVTATTNPPGLTFELTYDGGAAAPTNAGSYAALATLTDPNYVAATATGTLTIDKAPATVTLTAASLSAVYDGSPHATAATTSPAGLAVQITYDGGWAVPTHAGSYAVLATITDGNHVPATTTGTLTIDKAAATVTLTAASLSATYDGSPHAVGVTTGPPGLTVTVTYDAGSSAPTNAGYYAVLATVVSNDYAGTATGTLTIAKAAATVTIAPASLSAVYDGSPHAVTVTTIPGGLGVTITYDGYAPAPTTAGAHAVVATVVDGNYSGSATGTLNIDKAMAGLTLSGLTATFDGTPKSVSVVTAPPGLAVQVTYNSSATAPSAAGSYAVVVTVVDANYARSVGATLSIAPAAAAISGLTARVAYDGSPKAPPAVTVPTGVAVAFTYNGSATPPTAPGSYAVVATLADPNYTGSGTGTLTVAATSAVRHAPTLNGSVEGSVEVLLPESVTVGGSASVSTDLLVPGSPTVQVGAGAVYGGTLDGGGSAAPSSHTIVITGPAHLRHVVRRTDAVAFPAAAIPGFPFGLRNVTLTPTSTNPGDFATIKNLTLSGATGLIAVPAGTYGTFTAGTGGGFILGVTGSTVPTVYSFDALTLNGLAVLQVAGPVTITVRNLVTLTGMAGDAGHPEWLRINVAIGDAVVNAGTNVYGFLSVPAGNVTVGGTLRGGVISDRLNLQVGGVLRDQ